MAAGAAAACWEWRVRTSYCSLGFLWTLCEGTRDKKWAELARDSWGLLCICVPNSRKVMLETLGKNLERPGGMCLEESSVGLQVSL